MGLGPGLGVEVGCLHGDHGLHHLLREAVGRAADGAHLVGVSIRVRVMARVRVRVRV